MSQKQIKRYKRAILRNSDKVVKGFIEAVKGYNLLTRIKFAWAIVRAK